MIVKGKEREKISDASEGGYDDFPVIPNTLADCFYRIYNTGFLSPRLDLTLHM